ncbi:MAG: hypothetical protein ACFFHV_03565 [Promethearchaeota archaeon]
MEVPEKYIENISCLINSDLKAIRRAEERRTLIRYIILSEKSKNTKAYEQCIFCGIFLGNPKKPYKYKHYKITELRSCCYCLKKHKGKTLDEFPAIIQEKILNTVKNI